MSVKVRIIQPYLRPNEQDDVLNRIAIVYVGTEEFRVSAPSQAEGPAIDWLNNAMVRKPDPEGFGELDISDDFGARVIDYVREELEKHPLPAAASVEAKPERGPDPIKLICERFHIVARQLRFRHSNRPTIEINDEYDVQDLMHGLLRLFFDDVRPEDAAPSHGGSTSRIDFVIPAVATVVETKKTREKLTDKEVGAELLVDIGRYKTHPRCKRLVCFVYDPDGRIKNPRGLEDDLSRNTDGLEVQVFVVP